MDLSTRLRSHARLQPEAIAVVSRDRSLTYRKLWSRIERATARLQAEWDIHSGMTVAYCGRAHPDAIVLYVALARCGALLVPLKDPAVWPRMEWILRDLDIKLVVHDDDVTNQLCESAVTFKPLSTLIMTRCVFQPSFIIEDPARPSIVFIRSVDNGQVSAGKRSFHQLAAQISAAQDQSHYMNGNLFDESVFATVVIPLLIAGNTVRLS
jgi:acyl-CoA synthetase (AMP-forming)/AMP-acid ligase II